MMLGRFGNKGDSLGFGSNAVDEIYFGSMIVYGFFFHTLLQVISIVLGDRNTVLVRNCRNTGLLLYNSLKENQSDGYFDLLLAFPPITKQH